VCSCCVYYFNWSIIWWCEWYLNENKTLIFTFFFQGPNSGPNMGGNKKYSSHVTVGYSLSVINKNSTVKMSVLFCLLLQWWWKWFGENDSNSNAEWSERYNLYQTVPEKMSHNKPFVKSSLLPVRYKSHNTISIPKQFIRNTAQQGKCLTQSLQILDRPSTQITLFQRTRQSAWLDAVTTLLTRSEWILVH